MDCHIAVCDDEEHSRKSIQKDLEKAAKRCRERITMRFFESGRGYLDYVSEGWENILILDIDMPDMNGLEVAREVRKKRKDIILIFLSSHPEYVFQSFEVQPFRFIRKDEKDIELFLALRAAFSVIRSKQKKYIRIAGEDGEEMIEISDLIYAELWKRKLHFHLADGRIIAMKMTIKELGSRLEGESFVLLHSGLMVNTAYVKSHTRLDVTLKNGDKLPIARTRAEEVKKAVYEYWSKL